LSRALRRSLWILPLVWLSAPALSSAQDAHTMVVTLLGGVGGSQDVEPGSGFGNPSVQLGFALVTEPQTAIGLRVGRLDLSGEERFGALTDAEPIGRRWGEYRFHEGYYESGIYLGLGRLPPARRARRWRGGLGDRARRRVRTARRLLL
jgi:hypothetical protein